MAVFGLFWGILGLFAQDEVWIVHGPEIGLKQENPSTIKRLTAYVTAYTSDPAETDDTPDITASGIKIYKGVIACPRDLPFGTRVRINGEDYNCQDRMHTRFDGRFDIWMPNKAMAKEWGIQKHEMEIIGYPQDINR